MNKKTIEGIGELELISDSLFGSFDVKIFDLEYKLDIRYCVNDDGFEGLSQEMLQVSKKCLHVLKTQIDKIINEIVKYYETEVKEAAEDGFCDYIELNNNNQLSQIMMPKEFYVMEIYKGKPNDKIYSGMYFECDWSDEGFAIRFDENGNVIEVGTGDILY